MSGLSSVQSEPIYTFIRICCNETHQEFFYYRSVFWTLLKRYRLTKFVIIFLKFLMCHKFFNPTRHSLYMINNKFVQIGEFIFPINNKLTTNILSRWISIWFNDIYGIRISTGRYTKIRIKIFLPIC